LILTFSIDTEGHERLVCEIASWTWVSEMHPRGFGEVEGLLKDFTTKVLKTYFGLTLDEATIKGGLEYMSEPGTYYSEESGVEYYVDFIAWPDAKCVIEYFHSKKVVYGEEIYYRPTTSGRIEITLSEFRRRHPGVEIAPRRKPIQSSLERHLRRRK